ncbi:MAG: hypothetical protein ACSLFQ_04080 [Thermoanaerobaculia bacterium]
MTKHYGNDELVAHAFLPDEDPEIALHLASCVRCAQRFDDTREALRRHAGAGDAAEKMETFWKRQELSVMRSIDEKRRRARGLGAGFAAAAAIVFVVVGFWAGRGSVATTPLTTTIASATIASTATQSVGATQDTGFATSQLATDPWESEQLQDFQSVVAWETWVDEDLKKRGTI